MKRVGMVLLCLCLCVGVVGCGEEAPQPAKDTTTTASSASTTTTASVAALSDADLAAIVAPLLGVPDDESITYDVQEVEHWEAADRMVRLVQFFQNGIWCGGGFADPATGELLRTITMYFDTTDAIEDANASLSERLDKEIHDAYEAERAYDENQSTAGMVAVSEKYAAKWEQVAQTYYQMIMAYDLDDDSASEYLHTHVTNMKNEWESYYLIQSENYQNVLLTIYGGGTIVGPIFADYQYEMQRNWALRLVHIYEWI